MTLRVTLGLAVMALGLGLAALAGIPAMIENRTAGDVAVVVGLSLAGAGFVLGLTGIRAELRAWEVRKEEARRREANKVADAANLKVKRRRIQHTKVDTLVRLTEARHLVEVYRSDGDAEALRDQAREVRSLELENVMVDANLDFNANEFTRHGLDVEAFDNDPSA